MQSQNKLRDASDSPDFPSYIRGRTPLKKGQMTTRDLRDEFRRDPSLSILLSDDVFRKAIRKGIEEGVYIYKRGDLLAGPGDPMPSINIDPEHLPKRLAEHEDQSAGPSERKPSGGTDTNGEPITAKPVPNVSVDDERQAIWAKIANAALRPVGGDRVGEATSAVIPWPHQIGAFHRLYDN